MDKKTTQEYTVTWTAKIMADSHVDAALAAYETIFEDQSHVNFDVGLQDGECVDINIFTEARKLLDAERT